MERNVFILIVMVALSLCGCVSDVSKAGADAGGMMVKIPETETLLALNDAVRIGDDLYLKGDYSIVHAPDIIEQGTVMLNRLSGTDISGVKIDPGTDTIYFAAPFFVSNQGSGVFHYVGLFAYDPKTRQNTHLDSYFLGDRIRAIEIRDAVRAVNVSFFQHAPNQSCAVYPSEAVSVNLYVEDTLTWRLYQGMHPSWDQNNDGINDCEDDGTCDDSQDYTKARI